MFRRIIGVLFLLAVRQETSGCVVEHCLYSGINGKKYKFRGSEIYYFFDRKLRNIVVNIEFVPYRNIFEHMVQILGL